MAEILLGYSFKLKNIRTLIRLLQYSIDVINPPDCIVKDKIRYPYNDYFELILILRYFDSNISK